MSLELVSKSYGPYFADLSYPEQLAVSRYIDEMQKRYPEMAEKATTGPGNDGVVYVYSQLPDNDDLDIEVHEAMAAISTDILLSTGVFIVLMSDTE